MKKTIYILSAAVIVFMMQACPKSDDGNDPVPEADTLTMLTGNWRITGLFVDSSPVDVNSQDQFTLKSDNTYTITIPELSFFPTSGSWELSGDEGQLILNGGNELLNIISLSEEEMILEFEHEDFKESPKNYRLTLEKQ